MTRLKAIGEGVILFSFSMILCTLTVYGALGVDPTARDHPPLREVTSAHRQP